MKAKTIGTREENVCIYTNISYIHINHEHR